MIKKIKKSHFWLGQSTLEYAVLIACVIAGLLAMQIYLKRGAQGRFREQADSLGKQFDPADTTYHSHVGIDANADTTVALTPEGDKIKTTTTTTTNYSTQSQSGTETVGLLK